MVSIWKRRGGGSVSGSLMPPAVKSLRSPRSPAGHPGRAGPEGQTRHAAGRNHPVGSPEPPATQAPAAQSAHNHLRHIPCLLPGQLKVPGFQSPESSDNQGPGAEYRAKRAGRLGSKREAASGSAEIAPRKASCSVMLLIIIILCPISFAVLTSRSVLGKVLLTFRKVNNDSKER